MCSINYAILKSWNITFYVIAHGLYSQKNSAWKNQYCVLVWACVCFLIKSLGKINLEHTQTNEFSKLLLNFQTCLSLRVYKIWVILEFKPRIKSLWIWTIDLNHNLLASRRLNVSSGVGKGWGWGNDVSRAPPLGSAKLSLMGQNWTNHLQLLCTVICRKPVSMGRSIWIFM